MKLFLCISLGLLSSVFFAQNVNKASDFNLFIQTYGATASNVPEGNTEFFGQHRTVLVGLTLIEGTSFQTGISSSRVGNDELIEFPFLFRYDATEALSLYSGVQLQFIRGISSSATSFMRKETSFSIGADYQINKNWDSGIQFLAPLNRNDKAPSKKFDILKPIRLRTGIKF